MSHTIELRNVSKYYADEDTVSMGLSRIDLDLDMGEFVAITGESGSGKSTLLNVISGLDTYEEGEMFVCGEDTTAYGTEEYETYRKTYIGNIFQDFNLINSYTVYQNIEAVMLLSGKKKKECEERVNTLIEQVGLSEYRNTKVSKLSGGQKQRVAIARALAKNSPIIVADEPTGNLDSASADSVMETLARVSQGKLVVIVTHNYEQAEPYVTRKITLHDGRITEDKKVVPADTRKDTEPGVDLPGKMTKPSEIRLGVRNTFNLPAKFMLLFIVYFFVSTAVLGQYATEKNRMHETHMLGNNPCFINTNADRIIVKKADESSFTDDDFKAINEIPNISTVVKNDIALDSGVSISLGDISVEGPMVSFDQMEGEQLTYGHMPQNDYEIVIRVSSATDAYIPLLDRGDEYIGASVAVMDMKRMQVYGFKDEIKIAGIILDSEDDDGPAYSLYGYSTIYASEDVSNELLTSMMAAVSKAEFNFGGTKVINDEGRAVYRSSNVTDGKVFIFEDQTYYYEDEDLDEEEEYSEDDSEEISEKGLSIRIRNRFFESEGEYTVDKIIDKSNCSKLVGIPKDDYDLYYNCVFISSNDFRELFDKGYYQISVFMINEQDSDATQLALNEKGFTTLAVKESLMDSTNGLGEVLDIMAYGRLALEFIILLLIAYIVIRLIMRSRNSYYSTLRILGASKGNITSILRTELILMMVIAYGADLLFALLVSKGILQDLTGYKMEEVTKLLYFLTPFDYGVLGVVLLLMSLIITGTYSRQIFTKSAMKAFREGV